MQYGDRHGRQFHIEFDEATLECVARHNGLQIGKFSFLEQDWTPAVRVLQLTHLHLDYLPGFTNCGIGRAILAFIKEQGNCVVVRPHDGITRKDGSHLTEGAPGFIEKMAREGLVSCPSMSRYDCDPE